MAPKFDLLVVGEVNPDLVLTGDVEPVFGQVEKMLEDATLTIGSSACIFACGAARLGLRVAFIGKVGRDQLGDFMRAELARRGIDTSGIVVDPSLKTGLSVILSRGGDRAILTYGGSIPELRLSDIDSNRLAQARHLHLGSYYMLDRLRPHIAGLFAQARDQGLTTSLDANYDPTGEWRGGLQETLAHTDLFFPNETELLGITRQPDDSRALDALSQGEHFPSAGITIVVKRGSQGGTVRRGSEQVSLPALRVDVVDTTGAGDSFDAGFVYGYLHGWNLEKCLRLACVCGSLSTRASGGVTAQPSLEEALAYL